MPAAITPPAVPQTKDLAVPRPTMLSNQNKDMANTKRKIICFSGTFVLICRSPAVKLYPPLTTLQTALYILLEVHFVKCRNLNSKC